MESIMNDSKEEQVNYCSKKNYYRYIIAGLIFFLVLLILVSLMLGRYSIAFKDIIEVILNKGENVDEMLVMEKIVFNVRLPRIFTAIFVGAALSISGAAYQSIFKNPMVSPDLLGVTSGAGFGAAIAILLRLSYWQVQLFAFAFGIIGVLITFTISNVVTRDTGDKTVVLILSGMVIGSLFKSFISVTKYLADPNDSLQEITFWLMGSISGVDMNDFVKIAIPVVIGIVPILILRCKLNAMTFGEDEARALGIETEKVRIIIIISSTIITAASISICGIIGWVGLIIPHIARMIVGSNNNYLIPSSLIIGGIYMLIVDNISRTVFPVEIPIGILTAIIGTPFFLYLLVKTRRAWQ